MFTFHRRTLAISFLSSFCSWELLCTPINMDNSYIELHTVHGFNGRNGVSLTKGICSEMSIQAETFNVCWNVFSFYSGESILLLQVQTSNYCEQVQWYTLGSTQSNEETKQFQETRDRYSKREINSQTQCEKSNWANKCHFGIGKLCKKQTSL